MYTYICVVAINLEFNVYWDTKCWSFSSQQSHGLLWLASMNSSNNGIMNVIVKEEKNLREQEQFLCNNRQVKLGKHSLARLLER